LEGKLDANGGVPDVVDGIEAGGYFAAKGIDTVLRCTPLLRQFVI
jgi:hypothetical protein